MSQDTNVSQAEAIPSQKSASVFRDPTVVCAIIGLIGIIATNLTDIRNAIFSIQNAIPIRDAPMAIKNSAFLKEAIANNYSCIFGAEFYIENPSKIELDGTLCKETGDVFFRIRRPIVKEDGTQGFERDIAVVLLEDLVSQEDNPTINAGLGSSLMAYAKSSSSAYEGGMSLPDQNQLAQTLIITICQKIDDDGRTLIRRVKENGQCYDERWDSYSGKFKSRAPSSCSTTC